MYHLAVGLLGSIVLLKGVAAKAEQRKNIFFAIGNACMFLYALIGYLRGGPVFFLILQIFIAIATISMLLNIPDRYDTPLLGFGGLLLVLWALSHFEGYSTAIFVVGLGLLGIGFAMDNGTLKREVALMCGSIVIALFSFLVLDWVFLGLNTLFAILALLNSIRMTQYKEKR